MYRVAHLEEAGKRLVTETYWDSTLWRNYSCDDVSWMLRQYGYRIALAKDAVCHKLAGSGSLRPAGVMRVALECSVQTAQQHVACTREGCSNGTACREVPGEQRERRRILEGLSVRPTHRADDGLQQRSRAAAGLAKATECRRKAP